ncbi:MAG: PfkB family carbohydrate kinase, partial [Clostridia bacterium]|nr:PfkB family carbohydrate kinase [Clostridia bacterium]
MFTINNNARYGVACPTSMGARITPPDGQPVHTATQFLMQATSAETNVVTVSASLGYRGLALTNFVAGSPVAQLIKNNLRSRNIEYEGPDVPQGGPWGYRHQFNIADSGYGTRGPRVHNDRAGEVGRLLNAADYDFDRIFGQEGVGILHLSGLIAAISPETCAFCLACVEAARKHGTKICFDLNHRASFWKGREAELGAAFQSIAAVADILVGNEEDFQLALGIEGPEAGGKQITGKLERFQEMIGRIKVAYPNAKVFANTLRQVISVNEHLWGSV